jgi:hypothetical protein
VRAEDRDFLAAAVRAEHLGRIAHLPQGAVDQLQVCQVVGLLTYLQGGQQHLADDLRLVDAAGGLDKLVDKLVDRFVCARKAEFHRQAFQVRQDVLAPDGSTTCGTK